MQTTNKGKGTVLIIDDDRMIADLVKMAFAGDGFQVLAAQSGTELNEIIDNLDLTTDTVFDLILLDLLLPDTSGEELYHLLRANDHLAKIPIIILSAAAAVQKRIQLLKMGADDYIIKPFNVDDLLMRATVHIKLGKMRQAKNEVENRINLLEEIAQTINSPAGLDHKLAEMIDSLKRIVQAQSGDIFLPEHDLESHSIASFKKLSQEYLFQSSLETNSITADTLKTGSPSLVNDVQTDGRFSTQTDHPQGQTTTSILCAPLTVGQEFVCALRLFNKVGGFTDDDLRLVVSAGNIISVALENEHLNLLLQSANQG